MSSTGSSGADIFLLLNGEEHGPIDREKIPGLLECGDILPNTLACVAGMPGWRTLEETLVWADAVTVSAIYDEAVILSERVKIGDISHADLRWELRGPCEKKQVYAEYENLARLIEVEALLAGNHSSYTQNSREWDLSIFWLWPALELYPLGQLLYQRDWAAAWQAAGGRLYGDRMVARLDDPVWLGVSDFGLPFPPFSFDASVWTRGVTIQEAKELQVENLQTPPILMTLPAWKPFAFLPEGLGKA